LAVSLSKTTLLLGMVITARLQEGRVVSQVNARVQTLVSSPDHPMILGQVLALPYTLSKTLYFVLVYRNRGELRYTLRPGHAMAVLVSLPLPE